MTSICNTDLKPCFTLFCLSFNCSVRVFYVFDIDVLSRMSSSLLCIHILLCSLPYSCNERLTELRRPFFDDNDDAFEHYNFFKSR